MAKIKLNQGGDYQLCGILLKSGENQVSDADYSVLDSQGGFRNDVKNGLIEVLEAPETKPEALPDDALIGGEPTTGKRGRPPAQQGN